MQAQDSSVLNNLNYSDACLQRAYSARHYNERVTNRDLDMAPAALLSFIAASVVMILDFADSAVVIPVKLEDQSRLVCMDNG